MPGAIWRTSADETMSSEHRRLASLSIGVRQRQGQRGNDPNHDADKPGTVHFGRCKRPPKTAFNGLGHYGVDRDSRQTSTRADNTVRGYPILRYRSKRRNGPTRAFAASDDKMNIVNGRFD